MSVVFQGMKGKAGEGFNGKIIDIIDPVDCVSGSPCGAGYFTIIPISDWSYRKNNKTKAFCTFTKNDIQTSFFMTDDWGHEYSFIIDNDDPVINKVLSYIKDEHLG
jgi:hypothetical protein